MDFYKLGRIGAKAHWLKNHQPIREHIKKEHHKLSKEKARISGFLMGDGSVSALKYPVSTNQHHDFCFYPDDLKLAEMFSEDFQKLYLKKPIIRKANKYFKVRVSSKPAWEDLIKTGKFDSLNWEFPKSFSTNEEKIEWLRAIFDCEAYVGKKAIQLQSVSIKGIISVRDLLKEFRIESKLYKHKRNNEKWNTNYILCIMKREDRIKYFNYIGFNHPTKQEKLKKYCRCARMVNGMVSKTIVRKDS